MGNLSGLEPYYFSLFFFFFFPCFTESHVFATFFGGMGVGGVYTCKCKFSGPFSKSM